MCLLHVSTCSVFHHVWLLLIYIFLLFYFLFFTFIFTYVTLVFLCVFRIFTLSFLYGPCWPYASINLIGTHCILTAIAICLRYISLRNTTEIIKKTAHIHKYVYYIWYNMRLLKNISEMPKVRIWKQNTVQNKNHKTREITTKYCL